MCGCYQCRHCEERSDEAIQTSCLALDCFASLAMTESIRRLCPQPLRVDVDHQRGEQDQAADQDLQEAVDVDVVEAVVEHAEHEQADDGVADAAAAAEQAG